MHGFKRARRYEGDVDPTTVARVAVALRELGCYEISLGDTVGMGNPAQVIALSARSQKPCTMRVHTAGSRRSSDHNHIMILKPHILCARMHIHESVPYLLVTENHDSQ